MLSLVARVIPRLLSSALPVLGRLLFLVVCFRVVRFLIREWKGLGKR